MMLKRILIWALAAAAVLGCGPRRAPKPNTRPFPRPEIPSVYTDDNARTKWLVSHYWDKFLNAGTAVADSLNGVSPDDLEYEMGTYSTLLGMVPVSDGKEAVGRYFSLLEAFQAAVPESAVFPHMVRLTDKYLKDPNSPVRSDDLYQTFVLGLSESPLTDPSMKERYVWEARLFGLNGTGTRAADFNFIDLEGRPGSLYGTRAEYLVLIFGNPDCNACRELAGNMQSVPSVVALENSGRLKVMDIYIDEDIALWKSKAGEYPKGWIIGYDSESVIRSDTKYFVRAIPSIYLLDKDKNVLLKDATEDRLLRFLGAL